MKNFLALPLLKSLGFWKNLVSFSRDKAAANMIFKNKEGRRATVPYHSAKILHPKVLKSILMEADLTIDELKLFL